MIGLKPITMSSLKQINRYKSKTIKGFRDLWKLNRLHKLRCTVKHISDK